MSVLQTFLAFACVILVAVFGSPDWTYVLDAVSYVGAVVSIVLASFSTSLSAVTAALVVDIVASVALVVSLIVKALRVGDCLFANIAADCFSSIPLQIVYALLTLLLLVTSVIVLSITAMLRGKIEISHQD